MEKRTEKRIKRIVLIGPESTGKTELAKFLANKYDTVFVPEYAREYVENLGRHYTYDDVVHIAKKQIELEKEFKSKAKGILFYDTFLIITKVWFQVVYNRIPDFIDIALKESKIDLFLLCNTDIEWIPDNVRENGGEMREKLFHIYEQEIIKYGFRYKVVKNTGEERYQNSVKIVNELLNQDKN
jgi:NadR type nicotinamide-nucleotide adenylyltransferase